jgi:hypothetical protein
MRLLVSVRLPAEKGNDFVANPEFVKKIEEILSAHKAEAVYFMPKDGQRSFFYVADVADGSRIPSIVEPWWMMSGADVTLQPVFSREEMQKAGPDIAAAAKKYRSSR